MPRLQEFVGTREYATKPPQIAGGPMMQSGNKHERMKAIIQGLASSNDPQRTKSAHHPQDSAFTGRQLTRDEDGISSPIHAAGDVVSALSTTNTRWHGYRPVIRTSTSTNNFSGHNMDPIDGASQGDDIFGTDVENLDSTVASSDISSSDVGDMQSRLPGEADMRRNLTTNIKQPFKPGHDQQENKLVRDEYHGYQNNETVPSMDPNYFLRHTAWKEQDGRKKDLRREKADGTAGDTTTYGLVPDLEFTGYPQRPQNLPITNEIRPNSTPALPVAHKLASTKISMDSSTSMGNINLENSSDLAFLTSNSGFGAQSLLSRESRFEEKRDGRDKRYGDLQRGSSSATVNNTKSRRDNGAISKVSSTRSYEGGLNISSILDIPKQSMELDSASWHQDGTTYPPKMPEVNNQNLNQEVTNHHHHHPAAADSELSTMLQNLYNNRGNPNARAQQEAFFSALDITQSERCGEFFIDRFVDVVARHNAVRRHRRDLATALEAEIAARENHVRDRKEGVDQNLEELRQAGKGVVHGKSSIIAGRSQN